MDFDNLPNIHFWPKWKFLQFFRKESLFYENDRSVEKYYFNMHSFYVIFLKPFKNVMVDDKTINCCVMYNTKPFIVFLTIFAGTFHSQVFSGVFFSGEGGLLLDFAAVPDFFCCFWSNSNNEWFFYFLRYLLAQRKEYFR